ncbi:POK19 protein, partial [Corythaixoides concolor]|nr:POK19 protein [Corythaixoides concolor]
PQKLLRSINWVRPLVGITTEDLSPLFNLLKGDPDLTSVRKLTERAKQGLQFIMDKNNTTFAHRINIKLPVHLFPIYNTFQPYALLGQWNIGDAVESICLRIL